MTAAAPLPARLSLFGHSLGWTGLVLLGLGLWIATVTLPHPDALWGLVPGLSGFPLSGLYLRTLWRTARNRPLSLQIQGDATALTLTFLCDHRPLRVHHYPLPDIHDCGLTPVDSGFSSLWRPYLGLGQPPQRQPLPLRCSGDLRSLPPDQFTALLDQAVTVLQQHRPQALQRFLRDGPAYG